MSTIYPATSETKNEQICPQCNATVPVTPDYRVWCDQCNWNLQLDAEIVRVRSPLEALWLRMSRRHSQNLFVEVSQSSPASLKPTLSASKILALTLASIINLLSLGFLILGVLLFAFFTPNLIAIWGGLVCLGLAWLSRPRFGKMPEDTIEPEEFPKLFEATGEIARALGAARVDAICLLPEYTAAIGRVGLRRRKVLYLGVPLLSILDEQEFVGLLGHELAHNVNGDPSRSFLLGTAIKTLFTWYTLIHPRVIWNSNLGLLGLVMAPLNLIALGLAETVRFVATLLISLLWWESQRAEYLADYLAATVSGSEGVLGLLRKLNFGAAFHTTLQQVALGKEGQDLLAEFSHRISRIPERELERLCRLERLPSSRVDTTHPPTVHRISFLEAHRVETPKVAFSEEDLLGLKEELTRTHQRMQKRAVDAFRARLYY